jgi:hypothetical protein
MLPKNLPHLLLLSKKAKADLHRDLQNSQQLKLEGDFDNYFKLQIEQGQQVDALVVITPDVMQTLVQYDTAEDVEILSNQLFFILNHDKRDAKDVQQLVTSVVALAARIIQNINLASVPIPAAPVAPVPQPVAMPSVLSVSPTPPSPAA